MKLSWEARLGIFLILLSLIIYGMKYLITGDAENIFNYLFNSLGYLPLNVLLVTLILNSLLANRSKQNKQEKMNIVVGVFFSEIGTWLLTYLSDNDPNLCRLSGDLVKIDQWSDEEFIRVQDKFKNHRYSIDIKKIDIKVLSTYLSSKRSFSLRLLENPLLLENESFTNLLRAVFHLTEELEHRRDFQELPDSDYLHLTGDIERAYFLLVMEWMTYMRYLHSNYPYLFSLAMRTNPFDENACVVVK
ncbi:MAG: hypothetical protein NTX42_10705 [Methanothrix sp.]|nr:hypothetical protein [Methanothrix sp.]